MISLKNCLLEEAFNRKLENPSVSVTHKSSGHTLSLKFGSKDLILEVAYEGPRDIWLSSLCFLLRGKNAQAAGELTLKSWEKSFQEDQEFWDLWAEKTQDIFFIPLELLKASLDRYQGREYLYKEASPLICRCFGIREADLKADHSLKNKAGMGCRSCKPQLEKWIKDTEASQRKAVRHYKDRPLADWVLLVEEKLSQFSRLSEWKLEVETFKGKAVIISYQKSATQREEEETSKLLQAYLGAEVDPDLGFFLRRAKQR
jgi:hypothetical protein